MKKTRLTEDILRGLIYEEVRKALDESVNGRDIKAAIASSVDDLVSKGSVMIPVGNEGNMEVRLSGNSVEASYNGKDASVPCRDTQSRNALVNAVYMAFMYVYGF